LKAIEEAEIGCGSALQIAGDRRSRDEGHQAEAMARTGITQQAQEAFHQALRQKRHRSDEGHKSKIAREIGMRAARPPDSGGDRRSMQVRPNRAKAMARAGITQQAQETLHQALQAAKDIEERWRQAQVLKAIAEAMAEIGMWEQALQIAEGIEEAEIRAQALIEIAKAMARAGMTQQAQETLQAPSGSKRHRRTMEASTSLEGHCGSHAEIGMWEQALQIAEGIEEAEMRAQALIEIAKAMARAGMTGETLHQPSGRQKQSNG
jgi:tetratricopeptide (TPR) repeat protein